MKTAMLGRVEVASPNGVRSHIDVLLEVFRRHFTKSHRERSYAATIGTEDRSKS